MLVGVIDLFSSAEPERLCVFTESREANPSRIQMDFLNWDILRGTDPKSCSVGFLLWTLQDPNIAHVGYLEN